MKKKILIMISMVCFLFIFGCSVTPNETTSNLTPNTMELSSNLEETLKEAYVRITNINIAEKNKELAASGKEPINLIESDSVEIIGYLGEYGINGNVYVLVIKGKTDPLDGLEPQYINPVLFTVRDKGYSLVSVIENDVEKYYYFRKIPEIPIVINLNEDEIEFLSLAGAKGTLTISDMDNIYALYSDLLRFIENNNQA